jgi:hypothetical protein
MYIVYDLAFMLIVENCVLATTFSDLCTTFCYCLHVSLHQGSPFLNYGKEFFKKTYGANELSGLTIIFIERHQSIKLGN